MILPIGKRVVVKATPPDEATPGGIILVADTNLNNVRGEIFSVSNEVDELDVGNKVICSPYGSTAITHEGEEYLIYALQDILCVIS